MTILPNAVHIDIQIDSPHQKHPVLCLPKADWKAWARGIRISVLCAERSVVDDETTAKVISALSGEKARISADEVGALWSAACSLPPVGLDPGCDSLVRAQLSAAVDLNHGLVLKSREG